MHDEIKELVDLCLNHKMEKHHLDDYAFMKKQMLLRFKSRRYELREDELAIINLVFAFKWLQDFPYLLPDVNEVMSNG